MATGREIVVTKAAPQPGGAYSQAVVATGSVVACAGQIGRNPATGDLEEGLREQTRRALANLTAVLTASGCSWSHVIKTTCYLTNIDHFDVFDAAYSEVVAEPRPARSTVGVRLAGDLLVEIDAIAVRPGT